jgi:hypothetical protein
MLEEDAGGMMLAAIPLRRLEKQPSWPAIHR